MVNLEKSINKLEFNKIRIMLSDLALTEGAKMRALSLMPSSSFSVVEKRQELTENAKSMSAIKGVPSFNSMPEILDLVEKATKNSILSPREILDVGISLKTARYLLEYIHSDTISKSSLVLECTPVDTLVPQ